MDPGSKFRQGIFISVAGSKGKEVFKGIELTSNYFFDAIGADLSGKLTYRDIETLDDITSRPSIELNIRQEAKRLLSPLLQRKKHLIVSDKNSFRSQMADAFLKYHAGDRFEVQSCGIEPDKENHPLMEKVMAEKGIDVAYLKPTSFKEATTRFKPDFLINLGCQYPIPSLQEVKKIDWDIHSPANASEKSIRKVRDDIEKKVLSFNNMHH